MAVGHPMGASALPWLREQGKRDRTARQRRASLRETGGAARGVEEIPEECPVRGATRKKLKKREDFQEAQPGGI